MSPKNSPLFIKVAAVIIAVTTGFVAADIHPNAGKTSASFLKIGLGARAVAMGESYAGIADDVYAVQWNPAGLNSIANNELSGMHTEWLQGMRYEYASAAVRLSANSVGAFSIGYLSYGSDFERRTQTLEFTEDGPSASSGTFGGYGLVAVASYSLKLDQNWTIGGNLKGISENLDTTTGYTAAADLGALYTLSQNVKLGMVVQNVGPNLSGFALPINIKVGLGFALPECHLTGAIDINQPNDNYTKISAGLEYNHENLLFARLGYRYRINGDALGDLAGLTAGLGLKLAQYQLDYAFVPFGDLGLTHRISFTAKLGQ